MFHLILTANSTNRLVFVMETALFTGSFDALLSPFWRLHFYTNNIRRTSGRGLNTYVLLCLPPSHKNVLSFALSSFFLTSHHILPFCFSKLHRVSHYQSGSSGRTDGRDEMCLQTGICVSKWARCVKTVVVKALNEDELHTDGLWIALSYLEVWCSPWRAISILMSTIHYL